MRTERFPHIPERGRIVAFDALRSFVIVMVVVMHVSMTFMAFSPDYWYIHSSQTSYLFNVIVNIFDIALMPVMFFLSGYFAPASYMRKGTGGFVKDKVLHIALPFILGVLLIIPAAKLLIGNLTLEQIIANSAQDPFYLFYGQQHMWFLGVLVLLFAGYTLFALIKPPTPERSAALANKGRRALLLGFAVSLIAALLVMELWGSYTAWFDFAFFTVRPVKAAAYVCLFILGAYAWKHRWFTADGWMPGRRLWFTLGPVLCVLYILAQITIYLLGTDVAYVPRLMIDISCGFVSVLFWLLLGIGLQNTRLVSWLGRMAPYSYGMYWLHSLPTISLLWLMNGLPVSIYLKAASVTVIAVAVSLLLAKYVLKKLPLLRKMF